MARAGIKETLLSINQSKISCEKRDLKDVKMENFMNEFTSTKMVGKASIHVYNCKNKWEQKVGNPVRKENGEPSSDETVNTVYDYVGKVRDYFLEKHNRKSIDEANMNHLLLNVHYGEKCQNAYWDGDEMT